MSDQSKTLAGYIIAKKDPKQTVRDAYELSKKSMTNRRHQWREIYLNYHGYIREKFKKARRSNFHFHKIFPQVETEASRFTVGQFSHKPFVAVTPSNGTNFDVAQNREALIQYYYEHCPAWYISSLRMLKYTLLYGCGFRMPSWRRITQKIKKRFPVDIYGYRFYEMREVEEVVYDGLWFDTYSPTEVFPHPHRLTLEEKPWVVIEEFVSAEQLLATANMNGFDKARVNQIPLNMSGQNEIEYHMRQAEMGFENPESDEGIIRLQHYLTPTHFITLANDETIIRDVDNPFDHKKIPLVQGIKTLDPDSFWPISTARTILPNQKFANLIVDMIADGAMMNNWPIWKYKSNVDPNWLISVPNQRIPVETMEDVDIVRMPEMKQDLLQLKALIESNIEETTGYFGTQKGWSTQNNTATSDTIFATQGDQRIQFDVMTYEKCTLTPEAKLIGSMVEQFMPEEMQVHVAGPGQGAFQKLSKDDIRGEFIYRVSGISESIRRSAGRADLIELVKLAGQAQQYVRLTNGTIMPVPLQDNFYAYKSLFHSFDREDAEKFIIRPEVFGQPINTDQLSVNPAVPFPGAEQLQPNPITGGLGRPNMPSEMSLLGNGAPQRPETKPYQLLAA